MSFAEANVTVNKTKDGFVAKVTRKMGVTTYTGSATVSRHLSESEEDQITQAIKEAKAVIDASVRAAYA